MTLSSGVVQGRQPKLSAKARGNCFVDSLTLRAKAAIAATTLLLPTESLQVTAFLMARDCPYPALLNHHDQKSVTKAWQQKCNTVARVVTAATCTGTPEVSDQ